MLEGIVELGGHCERFGEIYEDLRTTNEDKASAKNINVFENPIWDVRHADQKQ